MSKRNKLKDLTKPQPRIIKLPISKFLDTKYRDYALYVISSRGIPSFYDALTPVQRYILKSSPTSFQKTLTVVGKSIEAGYHHGNSSLEGSINKLARPFGNALQILDGYGFFGSEVSPDPAAARYTSVKLSSKTNDIINKYKYLTTREPDGPYHPFWMDVPIGLTTSIVGIAVGYKTTILPRKLEHIKEFLVDKRKSVKPYFNGFSGSISKYNGLDNAWLLSSIISVEDKKIQIKEIPPVLKYIAVLKKLDQIISKFDGTIRIINNSNTKVDIGIVYTGKDSNQWNELQKYVNKTFSIIVTENPVFVKDGQVLVYQSVEQYLTDYKWQVCRLQYKNSEYETNKLTDDLEFNQIKKLFIEFILEKKRSNIEIDQFLKQYNKNLKSRLESLTSRKFTKDELEETKKTIIQLTKDLKNKLKENKLNKNNFEKLIDPTIERGISSKKTNINLFETNDVDEIDGILIWNGEDVYEEEQILENDSE